MSQPHVIAIAHRGASLLAPENTIAAFEEALRLGCRAIEFDVRVTSDGVLVVVHDDTVDRTTNGHGSVRNLTQLDLMRLDAGSWLHPRYAGTRIPTLEEALRCILPHATPVLELKAAVDPEQLISMLQRHGAIDESLVISFSPEHLIPLRKKSRDLPLGLLAEHWTDDLPQRCRGLDAGVLVLSSEELSSGRVMAGEKAGLEVWCYTVNDIGMVAACAALGVRGIITDKPDLIREKAASDPVQARA